MSGLVDDDNTMLVSGAYECVAENDNGVGTSEPLEVRVLCKLLFTRASNKGSRFAPTWLRTSHLSLLMSFHSMLQAVRNPFHSFRYQNDNNKQNFNQKLNKIDMSKDIWSVRYHLWSPVIIINGLIKCEIKFFF